MTSGSSQNAINVQVPEGFDLQVEFAGAGGQLFINGQSYSVNKNGLVLPSDVANDHQTPNLAQRVLEVGQRLRDGTVVLSVDLDKNQALFVPAMIFGGKAKFDYQNDVVDSANNGALHGHQDWRRITDDEGETLSKNWDKVAPAELQGRAAPWFWLASPNFYDGGRVRRGGEADWNNNNRNNSNPVPVVRSGPARSWNPPFWTLDYRFQCSKRLFRYAH